MGKGNFPRPVTHSAASRMCNVTVNTSFTLVTSLRAYLYIMKRSQIILTVLFWLMRIAAFVVALPYLKDELTCWLLGMSFVASELLILMASDSAHPNGEPTGAAWYSVCGSIGAAWIILADKIDNY